MLCEELICPLMILVCEEEEVGVVIEGDLVDLELELLLVQNLLTLHVDERNKILLVADGDRFTILRPGPDSTTFFKGCAPCRHV